MQNLGKDADLLRLGERVAAWARRKGFTAKQLSQRADIDVRTARSVFEGNCGPQTIDALTDAFRMAFVAPVFGARLGLDDPTIRLLELDDERREIATREAHLEALRAATGMVGRSHHRALRTQSQSRWRED